MTLRIPTCYTVWSDFGELGIGHATDPTDFQTAVSEYGDQMALGHDSAVFRVEPPEGDKAGMMIDVTDDAIACIARRERSKGPEMPDWLLDALGEPRPVDPVAEATQRNIDAWKAEA